MDGNWGKNSCPPALLRGSPWGLGCPMLGGDGNGMRSRDWDGVEEQRWGEQMRVRMGSRGGNEEWGEDEKGEQGGE